VGDRRRTATLSGIDGLLRAFSERVAPYFALTVNATSTLCDFRGSGDGNVATFASDVAARLRIRRTRGAGDVEGANSSERRDSDDAASGGPLAIVGKDGSLPAPTASCDVVLFAYLFHLPAVARHTSKLLREAARVSRGFVLIAEHRAGRSAAEHAFNTRLDAHGTYRSDGEWQELLAAAGLELVASGPMLAPDRTEAYLIARAKPPDDLALPTVDRTVTMKEEHI
jgi:hypothetical protein